MNLGHPDPRGRASPEEQHALVRHYPKAFAPVKGAWGAKGSTTVILEHATKTVVKEAIEIAWERRRATAPQARASGRGRAE